MEYCAVRGILHPSPTSRTHQYDVHRDHRGLVIAVLFDSYVGKTTEGPACELHDLRVRSLVSFILTGLEGHENPDSKDIRCALEAAFHRLDDTIDKKANELGLKYPPAHLAATKYNCVVVIVYNGFVYVAGSAEAEVYLARGLKPLSLTSYIHDIARNCWMEGRGRGRDFQGEPAIYYFRQEPIQAADELLMIYSGRFECYVKDGRDLVTILQSRIHVEGLNDACLSMVGPFQDGNKVLIVITLQPHVHESHQRESFPVDVRMLDTVKYDPDNDCHVEDPLRFLLPYVNGEKQCPIPQTSFLYVLDEFVQEPRGKEEIQMSSSLPLSDGCKKKHLEAVENPCIAGPDAWDTSDCATVRLAHEVTYADT